MNNLGRLLFFTFLLLAFMQCKPEKITTPQMEEEIFTFQSGDEYVLDEKKLQTSGNTKIEVQKIRELYELLEIANDKEKEKEIETVTLEQIRSFFLDSLISQDFIAQNLEWLKEGFKPHEIKIVWEKESDTEVVSGETASDSISEAPNTSIDSIETDTLLVEETITNEDDSYAENEEANETKPNQILFVSLIQGDDVKQIKILYELFKKDEEGKEGTIVNFKIIDYELKE